jgi:uncharacterized protein
MPARNDADDLRRRLANLGRSSAARARRPSARRSIPSNINPTSANLLPGQEVDTPLGPAYRVDQLYPLEHRHGSSRLCDVLGHGAGLAAEVVGRPEIGQAPLDQWMFLDTETTGLAGGAGTLVFLIGIGRFTAQGFQLRQYFLRDPVEEPGMLFALKQDLDTAAGFVTFNGQSFDLPLLEMRYVVGMRHECRLTDMPHLDLLPVARRLWRRSLPDCRMGTIERHVLGLARAATDVPGEEIPGIYLDYLRTRNTSQIERVLYHNAVDVLSLVGLAKQALDRYQQVDPAALSASEALAIARWHMYAGRMAQAERVYAAACEQEQVDVRVEALRLWSSELKRLDRRREALQRWEAWHRLAPDDPRPCIELAMYYEWHASDLVQARTWTLAARESLANWPLDWRRSASQAEVDHRLSRLEVKLERGGDG